MAALLWAGLGRFVGAAVDPRHIRAIVEAQLQLEAVIASDPAPIVKIGRATQGGDSLTLEITYWETGGSVARAVSVPLEA